MLKHFLVWVLIAVAAFGGGKYVIDNIDNFSKDSAGEVEVSKRALDDVKQVVEIEEIQFKEVIKPTSALRSGTSNIVQAGENGEKSVTYEIIYKDGKEVSRKKKLETITKRAKDKIIVKGTQP